MSALYLIRVPLTISALARWAGERGWLPGRAVAFDEGRALHHLVDEAFGPGALRPFRLLVPSRSGNGNLYSYSSQDHEELRCALRHFALPDHLSVLREQRLASKAMPRDWRVGQRLGFDVRVRPVRRLHKDLVTPRGRFRNGCELDAFLSEALHRYPGNREGMAEGKRSREAVYLDWLAERLACAAEVDRQTTRMVRFHRTRVARGERAHEGPDATIHGTLTVTQPDAFGHLLARGVGRHRAFGYGMLLLRPPHRSAPMR